MTTPTTKPTGDDPVAYIQTVEHPQRREDALALLDIMSGVMREPPVLYGKIIGFGTQHMVYDSGREDDFFPVGFAPRKQNLVIYIMPGFGDYDDLLAQLGKHKTGRSCLYVNKLADIDIAVLKKLIRQSARALKKKHDARLREKRRAEKAGIAWVPSD